MHDTVGGQLKEIPAQQPCREGDVTPERIWTNGHATCVGIKKAMRDLCTQEPPSQEVGFTLDLPILTCSLSLF